MGNIYSIYIVNLVFCVTILFLGILTSLTKKNMSPLFVGFAFGVFGLTNIGYLMGLEQIYTIFFLLLRSVGYLLVLLAMFREALK